MIQEIKQFLSTRKLKKEAKDIGMSLSFNPSECGYYTNQVRNHYSNTGNVNDPKVTMLGEKLRTVVKKQFDPDTQGDWDVLVYPRFSLDRKYIGFEIRLKF
jgi:hypothetical protein|nr:MAG TPA: hypothetical protein [Caudoviricetes sp.]